MCCPGGALTVTVNVSLTRRGLKAVVAATHALFCQVVGSTPVSIPMRTDATSTVLSGALKHRCGTRSWRSPNVTGVGGTVVVVVGGVVVVVVVVVVVDDVEVVVGGSVVVVVVVDVEVVVVGEVVEVVGGSVVVVVVDGVEVDVVV